MTEPPFGSDAWWRKEAEEHNRKLARKRAEQKKQIEKIERTGSDRDNALLNELQGNVNNLRQIYEWTYPNVTDSLRLRRRNLLYCSLLILRGAQVTK